MIDESKRQAFGQRWDLIPGGYQSLIEVSKVANFGTNKYGVDIWQGLDPESEQSPLNHAIAHSYKALESEAGSNERIWQLAKAAWNLLAQIWFEKRTAKLNQAIEEVENAGTYIQGDDAIAPDPAPSSALTNLLNKVTGN